MLKESKKEAKRQWSVFLIQLVTVSICIVLTISFQEKTYSAFSMITHYVEKTTTTTGKNT